LKELGEEMARKGSASSGFRNQKEEFLIEKYKAEIAMEKVAMEAEELETSERARERKNLIWGTWVIAIATVATVLISILFSSSHANQSRNLFKNKPRFHNFGSNLVK
jgi:hypothetical protein